MRKDNRPYRVKKAFLRFEKFYARRFLQPQFDLLGRGFIFMRPWYVELFGAPILLGDYATLIAAADKRVRLSVWPQRPGQGRIEIGDYCLICPGVRISSAASVRIGNNCMLASDAYLTDCDWHDPYDRLAMGRSAPVVLAENVWIGDGAIICKGVSIGANSIVGARSVVTHDIPANVIAAGNPAQVVRALDPSRSMVTRASLYANPLRLAADFDLLDRARLEPNTVGRWLRSLLAPGPED